MKGDMAGIPPIGWTDLLAWRELMGRNPDPYEVRLICAIDDAYLKVMRAPDEPKDDDDGGTS